jgi:hypothetical protein
MYKTSGGGLSREEKMGTRGVFVVQCENGQTLKVMVSGRGVGGKVGVSMDEFLQEYTPIQVTGLTSYNPNQTTMTIGLMIAEEKDGKPSTPER